MNYEYIKNYQCNDELMESYFQYTKKVFGFDLKKWRSLDHWKNQYIPHSLIENNKVIANVSAAIMKLQIKGKDVDAVQIGSVGVLSEYRAKGLSRVLMKEIIEEYKDYPLIFLFSSLEQYYEKFGFKRFKEITPYIKILDKSKSVESIKVTLEFEAVKRLLEGNLQNSSIIDAKGNIDFNWFHLMYIHKNNIYYIKDKDIVFLARYDKGTVDVYDIFSQWKVDFEEIKEYILKPDTTEIRFHFTPDWLSVDYDTKPYAEHNMFVLGEFPEDINNFKFPDIAVT